MTKLPCADLSWQFSLISFETRMYLLRLGSSLSLAYAPSQLRASVANTVRRVAIVTHPVVGAPRR